MLDRVPVNPGRVLVTPENGGAAYYATLTRADNPTQEGTPLNKASLLKDTTAALLGGDSSMVPDEAFVALKNLIGVLDAEVSGLPRIESGSYTGTGSNASSGATSVTLRFQHKPIAVFISTTNSVPQSQVLVRGSAYVGGDITGRGNVTTSLKWGVKSLTISNDYYGAANCFNESGKTYYYYAMYIGG